MKEFLLIKDHKTLVFIWKDITYVIKIVLFHKHILFCPFRLLDLTEDFVFFIVVFFLAVPHVSTLMAGADLTRNKTSGVKSPSHIQVCVRFVGVVGDVSAGCMFPIQESHGVNRIYKNIVIFDD